MPFEREHHDQVDVAFDEANAARPPGDGHLSPDDLPPVSPDIVEQELGESLDNIIPTRGYHLMPMVGLGGSAGGIQALTGFFEAMPPDSGMVFVVVLHLSPEHESTLADLLGRYTAMPVVQALDGMAVQPDHVYVIPPGKHLASVDGHLRLTPLTLVRGKRMAVDVFFRTLADTHGPHAAAIVLSGVDGDGAIGLKRIKERGGLTVVQDFEEAEHEGMPRSAIGTGMVDWVLKVRDMPARLLEYFRRETRLQLPPEEGPEPTAQRLPNQGEAETALREILAFLHTRTGRDFSYYKRATILRRISRRMQVNGLDTMPAYLAFLRTNPGEAGALLQDLLISVTNFFRDRDAFAVLERYIPEIFRGKGPNDSVRVWVAACATGEEAYSVAMLLFEHARTLEAPPLVQVFATDLDEEAIQAARNGIYPNAITTDVSEERLRRFFLKEHCGYRVRRELREAVLFAQHDLLKDSPFSKLDLVTCRNLLIYLNRDAQARALEIFHFALRPGNPLFLGSSESVDDNNGIYVALDKKHRLFITTPQTRIGLPVPVGASTLTRLLQESGREPVTLPPTRLMPVAAAAPTWARTEAAVGRLASIELHMRVLAQYGPPALIVDPSYEIVHLSTAAGRFLQFSSGEVSRSLLTVIHPMLRIELRAALYRAGQSQQPAEALGIPVDLDGQGQSLDIRVTPAQDIAPGHFLIFFVANATVAGHPRAAPQELDPLATQLERELENVKNQLRDVREQHEITLEEHKAINEELRSASEELETSREELQSINEELSTVNLELKNRVDELGHSNSDLHNLMNATAIATVFLDRELRITRYTPSSVELFNLIPTDVGRPLTDLNHQLDYPDLARDARRVLAQLTSIEREVGQVGEGWFLARLQPYRTVDDRIAGVVLTFVDIKARKDAEAALQASEVKYRTLFESIDEGFYFAEAIFDPAGQCVDILYLDENPAAARMTGQPFTGHRLSEMGACEPYWLEIFGQTARTGRPQRREECAAPGGIWYEFYVFKPPQARANQFALVFRDVTDRRRASEGRFRTLSDAAPALIWQNDAAGKNLFINRHFVEFVGKSAEEINGEGWHTLVHPDDREAYVADYLAAVREWRAWNNQNRIRHRDGTWHWFDNHAQPLLGAGGEYLGHVGVSVDITERRQAEEALRASEVKYRSLFESIDEGFTMIEVIPDERGRVVDLIWREANQAFGRHSGLRGVIDKRASEVLPRLEQPWLDLMTGVYRTGESARTEEYSADLGRWLNIYYSRVGDAGSLFIVAVFDDVTERKRAEGNRALVAGIADDLTRLVTPDEIIDAMGERTGQALHLNLCLFVDVDEERGEMTVHHAWQRQGTPSLKQTFRIADYMTEDFARSQRAGEIFIVRDTATDERTGPRAYARLSVGSIVAVPFHSGGRWVAYLAVTASGPRDWRADEIEAVREIAERVFPRIERARAEEAMRASEAKQVFLLRLSDVLRPLADPLQIQSATARVLGEHLGVDRAFYAEVRHEDWEVVPVDYHSTRVTPMVGSRSMKPFPHAAEILRAGRILNYTDIPATEKFPPREREAYAQIGVAAQVKIPLVKGGRLTAFLCIQQAEPRAWNPGEIALVEATAERTWAAVERSRVELALRQSEEKLQAALRAANMATFEWHSEERALRLSETGPDVFGTQPETIFAMGEDDGFDFIHPEDAAHHRESFRRASVRGEAYYCEYRIIRPRDGQLAWIEERVAASRDPETGAIRLRGIIWDITARKLAAEAVQAALGEAQEARGEAEAASQAKDHFLAILSHELRTPLMPISMALATLARRQDLPEAVREAHEMIDRNVRLEARFVDDLLDVTRVARGKMEIHRSGMDLHEAIRRAVEVSAPDLAEREQVLSLALDAPQARFHGDFARLQQAFWNLLKNASKFTPEGGAIGIRTRNESGGGIVVEVSDSGIGLTQEAIGRIFYPFEQADASITREFGGLGLGLAIAKASVEEHGGILRADSAGVGQGATFTVSLPPA